MRRSVLGLIAGMAALLVAAGVVASYAAHQQDTVYPPDSPQAIVSSYLHLLQDGQVDRAYALVSADRGATPPDSGRITLQDFHRQYDAWGQRSHRVTLVRSHIEGSNASVTVDIATFSGGTFGAGDQTERQTFTLARQDGAWLITGPEYLY